MTGKINWETAARKHGVYQKLEVKGQDVRPVSIYTFTFFLSGGGPAMPDRHPYYTATGSSPEEAERAAYVVYMRAVDCQHQFVTASLHSRKCKLCGVQLDTLQGALLHAADMPTDEGHSAKESKPKESKPKESGLKKLFSFRR